MTSRPLLSLTLALLTILNLYAQKKDYSIACIAFYNFENLFDTLDQPGVNDAEFTPQGPRHWNTARYTEKLGNLAEVVQQIGLDATPDGPALLGVAEIENRSVLEDFSRQEKIAARRYQVIHYDSPDYRGIDVALLYNPRYFRELASRPLPVTTNDLDGRPLITREALYVKGILNGDTLHILVNHWPSRRGGEEATRPLRNACAALNRQVADSLRAINPYARIIVMGDLNDDPINESVVKVLNASGDKKKVSPDQFYNPFLSFYNKGIGTLAYQDAWSLFDQIILSYGFVHRDDTVEPGYMFYKAGVFNKPWLIQKSGRYKGYPFRTFDFDNYIAGYSDHLATYVLLIKERKESR